ncbi:MAG: CatB-related O-acetyltransferase [Lachnospiraceae bacterium]|nr:CatB-related O-acetyltransferase [Lachnospiraceae bacterium]
MNKIIELYQKSFIAINRRSNAENKIRKKWRELNQHNSTEMIEVFDVGKVKVGKESYGDIHLVSFGENTKLSIGNYVSIAQDVHFILDADHPINQISTFPFKVKSLKIQKYEALSKGSIIIDDDVWIGYGVKILSGVHIGQGAIIGAGAVVTKDIPPYAIAVGTPAKVVKIRFDENLVDYLLTFDYSKLDKDMIQEHLDDLYEDISKFSIEEIQIRFEWFPKKNSNQVNGVTLYKI